MIGCAAHFTTFAPSGQGRTALPLRGREEQLCPFGAGKNSFAPSGQGRTALPHRGREGQRAAALHNHAGVAMGREPQQGTDGKQEQNQPWAKSQIGEWKASRSRDSRGQRAKSRDGRQEQGQPWAESQSRGRMASRNRATGAKCLRTGRTIARQQGQSADARDGR